MFQDMKSTFGETSTATAFGGGDFSGGATTSPFGQTFGRNTTTGFATPAFGSTSSSLFGSSTPTTGGLFGRATATPVFRQTQTTQSSAFGFPPSTTGSNLFGSQQNANTGLFGTSGTSAFGANKPAFGGLGTSTGTGLFGQQQKTQATTSLFGRSAGTTGTGIFGSGGFGASNTAAAAVGTTIKFTPITGLDTVVKNGVTQTLSTRHHCITCMKEYESKSLEELRLEDYAASRKGPQQAPQQTGSFGNSSGVSLFSTGFGASNTAAAAVGTAIKFTPVTGSDTEVTNGVTQTISTRHHCITCMKEYESKSLEELRLEDYAASRKGPQQAPQQTGSFGTSTGVSLFGTCASTSDSKSLFGGGFGASNTASAAVGTAIKFTPVTGSDTEVTNGVTQTISTRHHCITCMKEYESKSLEELRLEDYAASRKGPQQAPQQTGSFGNSSGVSLFSTGTGGIFTGNKSLFGGGFGASNTASAAVGTTSKFTPVTGSDTEVTNGVTQTISTRHHCITCMKEYESKSLEELRLEDYAASRKGPQQAPQQTGSFGNSSRVSLFSTCTGGIFTGNKSLFGGGFGSNSGGVFGSTTHQSGGFFGKSGFGTMTTTTVDGSSFSFNRTTASNPFGVNARPKPFGTAAPQTNSLFGATSQPSTFGTQPIGFAGFGTQNQTLD